MNILIITKNWLGDLLFQFPAVEAIRKEWPGARITCLTPERCLEIAKSNPSFDEVIAFDERGPQKCLAAKVRFIMRMRSKGPWDKAFLFHRSKTRALMAFFMGAKERTGYAAKRKGLLTNPVPEPENPMHHVDYFLNLVEKSGIKPPAEKCYRFYLSPENIAAAKRTMEKHNAAPGAYACFHLGANWEPKRWPAGHFAETADLIHEKSRMPVFFTGGPGDRGLAEEAAKKVRHARVIPIAGETSLGELGALAREAAFFLSADSGPMHIAAGSGAKVMALFGPTDPNLTGPRGTGEIRVLHYVPEGYAVPWFGDVPSEWMSKISPHQVAEALREKGWLRHSPVTAD